MSDARIFICEDCSYTIHSYGYDDGYNICGLCSWLRTVNISAEEKLKLLKLSNGDGGAPVDELN
jgi:hypothetical protein